MSVLEKGQLHGRVLVLGGADRMVLPILRSLGRRGIGVHVAWCSPGAWITRSRYLTARHPIPSPREDPAGWRAALVELTKRERFDLVIPTTDIENTACQLHRGELEPHMPLYLLSPEAFRASVDKVETMRLATALGVPCPRSVILTNPAAMDEGLEQISVPAVVKPCSSFAEESLYEKRHVRRVFSRDDLRRLVAEALVAGHPVIVQELVAGSGAGVELLAHEGEILYAFQHVRLHESVGWGSTYRMSTPVTPELLHASARLLRAVRHTGIAMVEFRVDPEKGSWHLMEINGRFWGSLPLAVAAGADFPFFLYEMLVRGKREFPPGYRNGVRSRGLTLDARWFGRQLRSSRDKGAAGWDVNRVSGSKLVVELARALTFRDHVDTLSRDDPGPFLAEAGDLAKLILRSLAGNTVAASLLIR